MQSKLIRIVEIAMRKYNKGRIEINPIEKKIKTTSKRETKYYSYTRFISNVFFNLASVLPNFFMN